MNDKTALIQPEQIEQVILLIRGQRVMLDRDLAALYDVETKNLNKAVRRNLDRFPPDFMFQLTADEADALRFQFGTLKRGQHFKYLPRVFTQEGVAMLSSVLRSPRAIQVNIAIMRVFVRLRETLALHKELAQKLAELECKIEGHDTSIRALFDAIRELAVPACQTGPRNRISRQRRPRTIPREKEMTMPNEFPYDVFLSHSAKDKPVVRPLAERLRADGLRVGFDEWEIPVAASRQSAAFSPADQEQEDGGALPRRRYAEKIEAGQEHSQFTFQPSAFSLQPLAFSL